jgi:hypothetical protein
VGGVQYKIEGFFDVCVARGLTGEQGVMIPASNIKNLMLREDVVAACRSGQFHIWAVNTIDEGLELLTGVKAGRRNKREEFTPNSVHARVAASQIDLDQPEGGRKITKRRRKRKKDEQEPGHGDAEKVKPRDEPQVPNHLRNKPLNETASERLRTGPIGRSSV